MPSKPPAKTKHAKSKKQDNAYREREKPPELMEDELLEEVAENPLEKVQRVELEDKNLKKEELVDNKDDVNTEPKTEIQEDEEEDHQKETDREGSDRAPILLDTAAVCSQLVAKAQAYLLGQSVDLAFEINEALYQLEQANIGDMDAQIIHLNLIKKFTNPAIQATLLTFNIPAVCKDTNVPVINGAITDINNHKFKSAEELTALLQQAGFNTNDLPNHDLLKLEKTIATSILLDTLKNSALKKVLAAKPQILISVEQRDKLVALTNTNLNYAKYYAALKTTVGPYVTLSEDEFNSIRAHNFLISFKEKTMSAAVIENQFKTFSAQLDSIRRTLIEVDKRSRIPFYSKLKNIFSFKKKEITIKQFVGDYKLFMESRAWFDELNKLQILMNAKDQAPFKNLLGNSTDAFKDFWRKNSDKITQYKSFIFVEAELLLKNNIKYYTHQIIDAARELKKAIDKIEDLERCSLSELELLKGDLIKKHVAFRDVLPPNKDFSKLFSQQADYQEQFKLQDIEKQTLQLLQDVDKKVTELEQAMVAIKENKIPISAEAKIVIEPLAGVQTEENIMRTKQAAEEIAKIAANIGSSVVYINSSDQSKTVLPAEADGLSYKIMANGSGEYIRSANYLNSENLSHKQKELAKSDGYTDNEKKILAHMAVNCVAEFLKKGQTVFSVKGKDKFCKKIAYNILAILPSAKIYINDSKELFMPKLGKRLFEIESKRKFYEEVGIIEKVKQLENSEDDLKKVIEIPSKRNVPGSKS